MLAPVRVTPPATAPVSLSDVKAHCRIELDVPDEDGLIEAYIDAATGYLDGRSGVLGRALITQVWRQDFRHFCWPALRLALAPVQSVDLVTYYDGDDVQQTLDPTAYRLRADTAGPYVDLAPGLSWPAVHLRADAVSVTFTAGYGDRPKDVPAPLRQAIRLMVAHSVAHREGEAGEMPMSVRALIAPYRRVNL